MNDFKFKQLIVVKPAHRAGKDGIDATLGLPAAKRPV